MKYQPNYSWADVLSLAQQKITNIFNLPIVDTLKID
jgi:hypothetical protein